MGAALRRVVAVRSLVQSRQHAAGFAGLRDGYLLIDGLCRDYWEGLHPVPEDGDVQQRVGNLAWLLSRSQQLIGEIPLTQADGARYGAVLWEAESQLANAVKRTPDNANELIRGKLTLDRFDAAVPVALALACYALGAVLERLAPGLGTSGPQMLVWGFFISTVVLFHATAGTTTTISIPARPARVSAPGRSTSPGMACACWRPPA
ncbi:hypothetical protein G6F32_014393 [Rhizopus arrhizus]|nr:hypothetical protein G6F32_014393 [Rhizopus arrhizus]